MRTTRDINGHPHRLTQRALVLAMLRRARNEDRGVEVHEFLRALIGGLGGRMHELRSAGFVIVNTKHWAPSGAIRSSYRLIWDAERDHAPRG